MNIDDIKSLGLRRRGGCAPIQPVDEASEFRDWLQSLKGRVRLAGGDWALIKAEVASTHTMRAAFEEGATAEWMAAYLVNRLREIQRIRSEPTI